jgi:hypothetical protein
MACRKIMNKLQKAMLHFACLTFSTISKKIPNDLKRKFEWLIIIGQGQIDKDLVLFGQKLNQKLANVSLALPGSEN